MGVAVSTPCKVNLHLGIHRHKDERGYHRVDSVMVPVALFDDVEVEPADGLEVIHEPALSVAPHKTTVYKAARMLAEALGTEPKVRVHVKTRIPEKAGLGGSSADAGATLRALAQLWGVDALDPRVVEVARRTGADVAFFLNPVPSLCVGAGDVLAQAFDELALPVVLAMPAGDGVSTKECYDEFDRAGEDPAGYEDLCAVLSGSRADKARDGACATQERAQAVGELLYNNLAAAAKRLNPAVAEVEAWVAAQPEVEAAQVTGSGSCTFGICGSLDAARAVAERASAQGWWSFATMTVGTRQRIC